MLCIGGAFSLVNTNGLFAPIRASQTLSSVCLSSNNNFLITHENLAKHTLADVQHVIIYLNGRLHLWKKASLGNYEEIDQAITPALMDPYILQKTLMHKHVEINLILNTFYEANLSLKNVYAELDRINMELTNIRQFEEAKKCSDMVHPMQNLILNIKGQSERSLIREIQQQYLTDVKPLITKYGRQAAHMQLSGFHSIMSSWSTSYPINFAETRVIITGPKGPRQKMIEVQYFEKIYKLHGIAEDANEEYIAYAESPAATISSIKINDLIIELAKQKLNTWVGEEMLGDKKAMNKDILAEYGEEYLDNMELLGLSEILHCPYKREQSY